MRGWVPEGCFIGASESLILLCTERVFDANFWRKKIFRNIFWLTFVYFKWRKVLKENLKEFEILKAKESLTLPNEKLWPFSCCFSWNKSEYVVSSLRWLCVELYLLLFTEFAMIAELILEFTSSCHLCYDAQQKMRQNWLVNLTLLLVPFSVSGDIPLAEKKPKSLDCLKIPALCIRVGPRCWLRARICKKYTGARNREGIWLSNRHASRHRLARLIPLNRFVGSINV